MLKERDPFPFKIESDGERGWPGDASEAFPKGLTRIPGHFFKQSFLRLYCKARKEEQGTFFSHSSIERSHCCLGRILVNHQG